MQELKLKMQETYTRGGLYLQDSTLILSLFPRFTVN